MRNFLAHLWNSTFAIILGVFSAKGDSNIRLLATSIFVALATHNPYWGFVTFFGIAYIVTNILNPLLSDILTAVDRIVHNR